MVVGAHEDDIETLVVIGNKEPVIMVPCFVFTNETKLELFQFVALIAQDDVMG
jgi:hypothetical protein